MIEEARDIGLVCWACGGVCDNSGRAGSEQRAERTEAAFLKVVQGKAKAEQFARAWKQCARRAYLRRSALIADAYEAGARKERARIVADLKQWAENVGKDVGTVDVALEMSAALAMAAQRYEQGDHWKVTP